MDWHEDTVNPTHYHWSCGKGECFVSNKAYFIFRLLEQLADVRSKLEAEKVKNADLHRINSELRAQNSESVDMRRSFEVQHSLSENTKINSHDHARLPQLGSCRGGFEWQAKIGKSNEWNSKTIGRGKTSAISWQSELAIWCASNWAYGAIIIFTQTRCRKV